MQSKNAALFQNAETLQKQLMLIRARNVVINMLVRSNSAILPHRGEQFKNSLSKVSHI